MEKDEFIFIWSQNKDEKNYRISYRDNSKTH